MAKSLLQRFEEKYTPEPNSGCWLWTAALSAAGYGAIGSGYKVRLAHIVSYEFKFGKVPNGLELDHKCRLRCCVNPYHLEPVTHRENCIRGDAPKRNGNKTHCPRGHEYSAANTIINQPSTRPPFRVCRKCRNVYINNLKRRQRWLKKQEKHHEFVFGL
jgi:hypothetical protein